MILPVGGLHQVELEAWVVEPLAHGPVNESADEFLRDISEMDCAAGMHDILIREYSEMKL